MDYIKARKETCGRIGLILCVILIFIWIAVDYVDYMEIAKSTVPIMDFWEWIAVYGQSIVDGTVSFADFFNSDEGQHIQPICMAINFWVLEKFKFDVNPLVEWGMILRLTIAAWMVALFLHHFRNKKNNNYLVQFLCTTVIILAILNYNQWEMTTEPFSLTNAFRVGNYIFSFYLADLLMNRIPQKSMMSNLGSSAVLGLYCAFLTIFVGAAYFVGHLVAIGLAMLWTLLQQRDNWKKYFFPMFVWGVISFLAACVYYAMVSNRTVADTPVVALGEYIRLLIEGVCLFWGAMFVHTNDINANGLAFVAILGALFLVCSVVITIHYLCVHRDGKEMFPVICVAYTMVISVAVSFGRVTVFGSQVMTSSRYVTESVISLIGLAWMTCDLFLRKERTPIGWIRPAACAVATIVLLVLAAEAEKKTAPHRAIYNDNLQEMMLNIEDYSDEELALFQANSPEYVRYSVGFFEENDLSIFYDLN